MRGMSQAGFLAWLNIAQTLSVDAARAFASRLETDHPIPLTGTFTGC